LARHNHWTTFAHAFLSFRIEALILVDRQLAKHVVGIAWNEVSRRYVDNEPEFWFPEKLRGRPEGNIKQGSGENFYDDSWPQGEIATITRRAYHTYKELIEYHVVPEQARMVLPQHTITEWIWSGSLAAFCRVCK